MITNANGWKKELGNNKYCVTLYLLKGGDNAIKEV